MSKFYKLKLPQEQEEYEACYKLLNLLGNLGLQIAKNVYLQYTDEFAPDWTPKDCCERLPDDCYCSDDNGWDDYYDDRYDDEDVVADPKPDSK